MFDKSIGFKDVLYDVFDPHYILYRLEVGQIVHARKCLYFRTPDRDFR